MSSVTGEIEGVSPAMTAANVAKTSLWTRFWRAMFSGLDWLFGFAAVLFGVAVLSIVPVLNFLSLGYLLECSGRIARSGRFRDGFVGIRKASVLGGVIMCSWLVLLPLRLVSSMWKDAELIQPGQTNSAVWVVLMVMMSVLAIGHIAWACIRGGRAWHFLWPAPIRFVKWLVGKTGKYRQMRDGLTAYVRGLRLPYFFWLGLRGFLGSVIWLILPVGILLGAAQLPNQGGAALLSVVGGLMLMVVVAYLPFFQVQFGKTGRFESLFHLSSVRRAFRRAPLAHWVALLVTLSFALPLYFLKIELTPRELAWLPALFFVGFIFPARLLSGWAVMRGERREYPAFFLWRWLSRFAVVPVVWFYVFFVYLNQYLSWTGSLGMLEQHAFLVPAPLLGW